jgi:uncharacterized ferritin-like protein (DUF455 family)
MKVSGVVFKIFTIVGMQLRHQALFALCLGDPQEKVQAVQTLWHQRRTFELSVDKQPTPIVTQALPGRPERPYLIPAKQVPTRKPFTPEGLAALVHAVCHIEFNAINLALDAVWRFAGMPAPYYRDWLRVAFEESQHFMLLHAHLQTLGYAYGDFGAHDGLWTVCHETRHDVLARMALVPRTLEARGLDATPVIQARLRRVATPAAQAAVEILDTILREEVGHVAIGNRWFHWVCERDGQDPLAVYPVLAQRHRAPRLKPPFNLSARRAAGFEEAELQALADL